MNEKVLRHKKICDGLNELYARKNHDYGDSFHTTFVEEGLAMARIRLGDKFSRFKTLSRLSCNDSDQQQVSLVVLEGTVLDPMQVYEDLDEYIVACGYDVRCFGYDPYNAKEFVERWAAENGPFGIEKVIQGAKTESVPLGELKKLAEDRMLLFDEELMTYAMGNCIAMEDTNGNRKLMKKRYEQKIDAVSAMMDAYIAYKRNPETFE